MSLGRTYAKLWAASAFANLADGVIERAEAAAAPTR
jgi:hypothetical protein